MGMVCDNFRSHTGSSIAILFGRESVVQSEQIRALDSSQAGTYPSSAVPDPPPPADSVVLPGAGRGCRSPAATHRRRAGRMSPMTRSCLVSRRAALTVSKPRPGPLHHAPVSAYSEVPA
jgi:hypothetical protein